MQELSPLSPQVLLPSRVLLPSQRPQVLSPLQTEYTVGHCFNYGPAPMQVCGAV
jgi:hypothetical protein